MTTSPLRTYTGIFRAGQWVDGSSSTTTPDINPYNGETLTTLSLADRSDVDASYQAAARAQQDWAQRTPNERAAVIEAAVRLFDDRHEEVVDILIQEAGSTRLKAEMEWQFTRDATAEAARLPFQVRGEIADSSIPGKENRVYRQPLGVVLIISPWNFPLYLTQRSLAPALALGNAAVVKPASNTPVAGGLLLASIFEQAGLPEGLLSVLVGSGREIGDYIVEHDIPRLVSFTGSTSVGQHVAAVAASSPRLKRVALELGGNAPLVVLDDADLDQAVDGAVFGRFLHQGQICMSTNRIIVDASIHDDFVERFVAKVATLRAGDPDDPNTLIGPIIDQTQFESVTAKIARAREQGAQLVLGGEPTGHVIPAHVFDHVTAEMDIANEEIFGPVAPILTVSGEEEALALANDTPFGLSSAVYTSDLERGVRFARRVEAGMTHVNDITVQDEASAPFGGEKNSGIGRFHGQYLIDELTTPHWISVQHTRRTYPLV